MTRGDPTRTVSDGIIMLASSMNDLITSGMLT